MIKLEKIVVRDMLDDTTYWVQGESMISTGKEWKLKWKDELDRVVRVYAFQDIT